jgi:hypothetical protein
MTVAIPKVLRVCRKCGVCVTTTCRNFKFCENCRVEAVKARMRRYYRRTKGA